MKLEKFLESVVGPDIIPDRRKTRGNTTVPSNPRRLPTDVVSWDDFDKKVADLLRPHLNRDEKSFRANLVAREPRVKEYLHPANEGHISRLIEEAFEIPTTQILSILFGMKGSFDAHLSDCNIGNPDCIFFVREPPVRSPNCPTDDAMQKARLVMEFKTPWALELPKDLIKAYNQHKNNRKHKVTKAVHQLYGYMSWNDVRFGVLSNYTSTFFLERHEESGVRVSREFRYSETGLESVVAAMVYICHYVATTEYYYYSPVDMGPRGTHIMTFDPQLPILHEGTWKAGLTVPWKDMQIIFRGRLSKRIATVVKADVRHRKWQTPANGKFSHLAICKIYDLTSKDAAREADQELEM
ncbi:hypothetical protein ABW21_db0206503 [Orbilia brochopaga]|nr:hypothetical protein ABW21_db0206503 [Drechslerella brochopaga]